ncbi:MULTISPECIES: DUF4233 domain-containing protein [unclassified Leifsonia]|uniref:DUF4233 domain-containing protein n=1 Tax=unclassified Leifsonia TaxID=2663824 RepID=UPI0006F2D756|nr:MULTISPECIES: DUF4233 domain-containing protein [unclassified Leifsonia]KQX06879.1 hypothetical protein ASC59_03365 [Leifsonia sp. Root1293]KRA11164.1 hypothetical protein ASD61_03365 [Leifsonia sp. Root60]
MTDATPGLPDPEDAPDAAPPRRSAAPRSIKRSLASIVLGFELIVVFLAALVNYGLPTAGLVSIGPVAALVSGGVVCLLIIITLGLLRYPFAYVLGWIVQALILLAGFLNPGMFFVGAIFAAMWTYAMISGGRIDRNNKEYA